MPGIPVNLKPAHTVPDVLQNWTRECSPVDKETLALRDLRHLVIQINFSI